VSVDPSAVLEALRVLAEALGLATGAATDELVRLPGPLERAAADRLVRDGLLPAVKIGRHKYSRRSDLLALVERLAKPAPVAAIGNDVRADLAAIAARTRAGGGR
jgi:hypothetical protein